jgi:hypothetical protein
MAIFQHLPLDTILCRAGNKKDHLKVVDGAVLPLTATGLMNGPTIVSFCFQVPMLAASTTAAWDYVTQCWMRNRNPGQVCEGNRRFRQPRATIGRVILEVMGNPDFLPSVMAHGVSQCSS